MTGIPDYNYPFFEKVANWFEMQGFSIESPHRNPPPSNAADMSQDEIWQYYMELCKEQVEKSEGGIILLRDWAYSKGARQELEWATSLFRPVYYFSDECGILELMSTYGGGI